MPDITLLKASALPYLQNLITAGDTGEATARQGADDLRSLAIRDSGILKLGNYGGTGDAITADLIGNIANAGISTLSGASEIEYIPVATNSAPNPAISIGGTSFGIRNADGGNWPAGAFVVGRSYKLRRRGTVLHVVSGDVVRDEIQAEIAARIAGDIHTLSSIGGTADAITASLPAGVALAANMRVSFTPAASNTGATTLAVNGGSAISIRDPLNAVLQASDLVPGMRVTAVYTGSVWRLDPGTITRAEYRGLVTAAAAALSRANHTGTQAISTVEGLRGRLSTLAKASIPKNTAEWLAARKSTVAWQADIEIGPEHAVTSDGPTVTSVVAGGLRGGTFAVQDAANPAITLVADGIQFANGAWLRHIPAAFSAGKVLLVVDVTPGATAASAMVSAGVDLSAEATRFVAKFPGLNSAFDTRADYVGRRQVVAMLADADNDIASIVQRDGNVQSAPLALSTFNISDFRMGRFGTYTIHRLWAFFIAPGTELPVSIEDAWKAMAQDQIRSGKTAAISWGFGQSIYQSAPVDAVADQVALEEPYRRVLKRLTGLVTTTGAAVNATGAGETAINQTVAATGLAGLGGGAETIQFAAARARMRRLTARGEDMPLMIVGTNGYGGRGIEEFDDDPATGTGSTTLWQNNRYWLQQARAVAAAQGYTPVLKDLLVIHGTADKGRPRGWYLERAKKVIDLHLSHAFDLFGYAPKLIMGQAGGDANTVNDGETGWGVVLDQIDLIRHYDGLLIGPEFAMMISDDNVHPDWKNRALFGELADEAQSYYEAGLSWNLLWPDQVTVTGNQVIIPVNLPHGCNMLKVPEPNKYAAYGGFCDNLGFTAPGRTITDVALSGRVCTVTLDAAPTVLCYAKQIQNIEGHRDAQGGGYTAHRGLIATDWTMESKAFAGVMHRRWLPSWEWTF